VRHASSVARDADDLAQELGLGGEDRAVITPAPRARASVRPRGSGCLGRLLLMFHLGPGWSS
jgi:hypothetical protein